MPPLAPNHNEISREDLENSPRGSRRWRLIIWGAILAVILLTVVVVSVAGSLREGTTMSFEDELTHGTVFVSAPFRFSVSDSIINAVTLAFEEVGYSAGGLEIDLEILDDGDEFGIWQAEKEISNANQAAADPTTIAYIGAINSGATKLSMPILNRANIAQISPASTWPGLTKIGFIPGEPGVFFPTGNRHFVRVVTTDDVQGPAAARWAFELGFRRVYVVDDGETYGYGIAKLFNAEAERLGIEIIGQETIDGTATEFGETVARIIAAAPDLVYFGGPSTHGIGFLLPELREAGSDVDLMGPDGIALDDFVNRVGVEYAEGVYATSIGLPIEVVETESSREFSEKYKARFGEAPDVFAPLGYEAARVVIAAINRARVKSRAEILREIKNTSNFAGLYGNWGFDERGDTTLRTVSGYRVQDGRYQFVRRIILE